MAGLEGCHDLFLYNRSRKRGMERRGIRRGGERKTGNGILI
jgi:hypothetical protein